MKVSIIGGGGLVGSCAAYALQCGGIVREIALLDVNANLAAGHALDLMHGSPSIADQILSSGGYEHIPDSDVICITAGLRRKPEESRLDLINRNTDLFSSILVEIQKVGVKKTAVVVVVSNPVDILTSLAASKLGLPVSQVLGLGTQLDFRCTEIIPDADPSVDFGRAWRQHGSHLVERYGRWIVLGQVSGLEQRFGREDLYPDQGFGGRVPFEKGRSGLCRRHRDSGRDPCDRPGSKPYLARQHRPRWSLLWHSRRCD